MTISTPAFEVPYVHLGIQHQAIKEEILEAVEKVIDQGQFILGSPVMEFEKAFAERCGVKYAIGVNSGTDALIFALKALNVGPGDEVITPCNSFVASASCIALTGATPVLVDVDEDYNLDVQQLEKVLTPRTKAVLPVHLTGRPANMEGVLRFAEEHHLFIIEDCAQAIDAEYKRQKVGSFGIAGCFSLHPLKTLNACGDGGVIVTNSEEIRDKISLYRNLGLETRENCVLWSSNSRLDTIQAAILLVKLKYLEQWTEQRISNARFYQENLKDVESILLPRDRSWEKAVYHTFVIQADNRDDLQAYLKKKNIGSSIHYPLPIHLQEVGRSLGSFSFPRAESQAKKILSLPIHQDLKIEHLNYVVETIRTFYKEERICNP